MTPPNSRQQQHPEGDLTTDERIHTLQSENDRLSLLLRDRQVELGQLKSLIGEMELKLNEREAVDFENQNLKNLIRSTFEEGEEIQRRMSNYENKGGSLSGLDTSVEILESNLREGEIKNNILIGELDNVNSLLSTKRREVQELNSKCLDMENDQRLGKIIE